MSVLSLSPDMFKIRRDDFSAQVSCDHDPKFWFRLEVTQDGDKITDFLLGAFDPSLGGDLLAICYNKIAKLPQHCIVFGDFLPSGSSDPGTIEAAKARFEGYARLCSRLMGVRCIPRGWCVGVKNLTSLLTHRNASAAQPTSGSLASSTPGP
jgi:hypothetical protein